MPDFAFPVIGRFFSVDVCIFNSSSEIASKKFMTSLNTSITRRLSVPFVSGFFSQLNHPSLLYYCKYLSKIIKLYLKRDLSFINLREGKGMPILRIQFTVFD